MISFATKSDLRRIEADLSSERRSNLRNSAESRSPLNATFLSHSTKDEDLVVGAIEVLTNHGASVYIDKIDPAMPPYTSAVTANLLKARIRQSKKFVLLATENSKASKWVPWELGLADGYKDIRNLALFPALESAYEDSWTSWEYMGLYRKIVWGNLDGYQGQVWMVYDKEKNTATELSAWLCEP